MNRRTISRALAVLLLAGLLANWRLALWMFRVRDPVGAAIGVSWLALIIVSVIGLLRVRRWGVYCLFALAPLSTAMLAAPLLPGMQVVGLRGPLALVAWNAAALVGGVVVLRAQDPAARAA